MKPREYELMVMAVSDGIESGWRRAHKHVEKPDEVAIKDEIHSAVMLSVTEWFDFDENARSCCCGTS